jgi:hypothetical protein
MKKSQLKQLVREIITEVNTKRLTQSERQKISKEMHKYPELGGNTKVSRLGAAIGLITKALDDAGFDLDMVTGDTLLGAKGNRLLTFRRKPTRVKARDAEYVTHDMALDAGDRSLEGTLYNDETWDEVEGEEITNSRIFFAWENLAATSQEFDKRYEVIAYLT